MALLKKGVLVNYTSLVGLIVSAVFLTPSQFAAAADPAVPPGKMAGAESLTTQKIDVDFSKSLGKLRPLHGVNNGPFDSSHHVADMAARHKEAGFPSVRLHDCQWPTPTVVDIPTIFPLFHADPDDPKNYIFAPTDRYLEAIVTNAADIVYRLGVSIEHKTAFHTKPPEDFAKWAKICINVIRHYNDGWNNGFKYNIKYFEIWNEPENGTPMWSGTIEQYFEMYRVAATAIKAYNPALKIGGPVATSTEAGHVRPFLTYCRDRKVPLDFFTWHCYTDSVPELTRRAAHARGILDEFGFKTSESMCTEWKGMIAGFDKVFWQPNSPSSTVRDALARNRNHEAAAFAASALLQLQDRPITMAHYYTADNSPWGMFDEYGVPGKVFFALKAFNLFLQTPNRVAVTGAPGGNELTACAGLSDDRKRAALLLSNYRGKPSRLQITLKSFPLTGKVRVARYLVDETQAPRWVAMDSPDAQNPVLNIDMPPGTVCLVRMGFPD